MIRKGRTSKESYRDDEPIEKRGRAVRMQVTIVCLIEGD
jgi:hypothetical protein